MEADVRLTLLTASSEPRAVQDWVGYNGIIHCEPRGKVGNEQEFSKCEKRELTVVRISS